MDKDPSWETPRDISHLLIKVVDIGEAANWIAHCNFAGGSLAPRALIEFCGTGPWETEPWGKEELAFELLWARAEAGDIRMFGRKALLVEDAQASDGEGHWGEPAREPALIPPEIVASASWTEDDGGGIESDEASYWSVTVHYDDLIKWFPERTASGRERAVDILRTSLFDAARSAITSQERALASVEGQCRRWIADLAAQGAAPRSRNDLFSQALGKFPNGLTRRGFDRCWDSAAPESWKRAGRKPRQD